MTTAARTIPPFCQPVWRHVHRLTCFVVFLLPVACSSKGGEEGAHVSSPSRDTPNYLASTLESQFFRWTRAPSDSNIQIRIWVNDSQVPVADRPKHRAYFIAARAAWKNAITDSGVDIGSETRWSTDPGATQFPTSSSVLKVNYVTSIPGLLGGVNHTLSSPNRVRSMNMTLALKDSNQALIPDDRLAAVVVHEMGHAFGIYAPSGQVAHSSNAGDVMFGHSTPYNFTTDPPPVWWTRGLATSAVDDSSQKSVKRHVLLPPSSLQREIEDPHRASREGGAAAR